MGPPCFLCGATHLAGSNRKATQTWVGGSNADSRPGPAPRSSHAACCVTPPASFETAVQSFALSTTAREALPPARAHVRGARAPLWPRERRSSACSPVRQSRVPRQTSAAGHQRRFGGCVCVCARRVPHPRPASTRLYPRTRGLRLLAPGPAGSARWPCPSRAWARAAGPCTPATSCQRPSTATWRMAFRPLPDSSLRRVYRFRCATKDALSGWWIRGSTGAPALTEGGDNPTSSRGYPSLACQARHGSPLSAVRLVVRLVDCTGQRLVRPPDDSKGRQRLQC